MQGEISKYALQIAGFEIIFEGDGFGFSQFRNTTPTGMLNLIRCVQDRSPICVRGIHLINTPRLFNMVFNNMVKPFLNERIKASDKASCTPSGQKIE